MNKRLFVLLTSILTAHSAFATNTSLKQAITEALSNVTGTVIFMNCATGATTASDTTLLDDSLPPCSTFKIWNTLIGSELGFISNPDAPFYIWDGKKRFLDAWNKDLTFREAFQVSCVPAFQNLARKTGAKNMQHWIDTLQYGDRNISSGIDIFWLPREGKKSIVISPRQQAHLIMQLVNGTLPFTEQSKALLKTVMLVKETPKGILFGKTGSGSINGDSSMSIGWYVGYVTSTNTTWSFACLLKGNGVSGKEAKEIVESILVKLKML